MSVKHSIAIPDTHRKRYFQVLIVALLLQPTSQILAQSEAQERRWGEWMMGSFGIMALSGSTAETLKDGWSLSLMELHLAVTPRVKGLRVGFGFVDGGTNVFRLNSAEKVAMRAYEYVTYGNGFVVDREPVDEVYCSLGRISASVKWYPVDNGFSLPSSDSRIRPFVSAGYSLHRISTTVEGGETAWGAGAYSNFGIDLTMPSLAEKSKDWSLRFESDWFLRFEVLTGAVPDWNVRIFPELRPVRGGSYRLVRFGAGVTSF